MEQIQAILKGVMGLGIFVAVGILLYACVAGGSTHGYSAPNSFTVSNDAVAHLVPDAIAGDSDATKMDGSPVVDCTGEATQFAADSLSVTHADDDQQDARTPS